MSFIILLQLYSFLTAFGRELSASATVSVRNICKLIVIYVHMHIIAFILCSA